MSNVANASMILSQINWQYSFRNVIEKFYFSTCGWLTLLMQPHGKYYYITFYMQPAHGC